MDSVSRLTIRLGLFVILAAAAGQSASASTLTYYGLDDPRGTLTNSKAAETNFLATLSSYGTDTLEASKTFVANPSLNFTGTANLTATTNSTYIAALAMYAVSGTKFLSDRGPANDTLPGIPDVFTLSTPVTAFGFYASNGGDAKFANTVSLLLENTVLGTSKSVSIATLGPGASQTNVFYFGVTDTAPFNRVSLVETYDFDGVLLDNITAGNVAVVPEPSTLLLAGMGIAALLAVSRKHKHRGVH